MKLYAPSSIKGPENKKRVLTLIQCYGHKLAASQIGDKAENIRHIVVLPVACAPDSRGAIAV